MKKGDNMRKYGFTIIEVVLVLGIAGLIFLMMMIALPALQRQQRDTKRKEDIDSLISNIKKYQTNNRGTLPINSVDNSNNWKSFEEKYMKDGFEDPSSGEPYKLSVYNCEGSVDNTCSDGEAKSAVESAISSSFEDNNFNLYIITSAKCAGDESKGVIKSSNPRKYAVIYKLEGGGLYCQDA